MVLWRMSALATFCALTAVPPVPKAAPGPEARFR